MQDRDFEKFTGGPTQSPSDRLHVTINKENVIGLNGNCYRLLGKPHSVFLYFSRNKDTIAVEPAEVQHSSIAFPVKEKSTVGWRINASPFCKHFGIRLDTTERFVSPDIRNGTLYLNLRQTVTVRQIRRKKKQE